MRAVRSAVSACAIRSHHGPNSITLPASTTITGKANDCSWLSAGSARATSTAPTIISAAPTRPRLVVAMPLRMTITPAATPAPTGSTTRQPPPATQRHGGRDRAGAEALAPARGGLVHDGRRVGELDGLRRRHHQVGEAVERDADPAEDRQQDERDPHVLDVDPEVPRDARADARELAVLACRAPGCRRRWPWSADTSAASPGR